MRVLAVLPLLLAGCFGSQPTAAVDAGGLDFSYFLDCPVVFANRIPCEPAPDWPLQLDVEPLPPTGWRCMTFADQRFERGPDMRYPFPDWYTYYGPHVPDGAGLEFRSGILYDAHNDTQEVAGALQVRSENKTVVYTFMGPPRGFIRIPQAIEEEALYITGILYPARPGPVAGEHADQTDIVHPGFNFTATGADVAHEEVFLSMGPHNGRPAMGWRDPDVEWWATQNVAMDGLRLHLPAWQESPVAFNNDTPPDNGLAAWGQWRGSGYNTTLRHGPVSVDAVLQPYMNFYSHVSNVREGYAGGLLDWLCRCPDELLADVDSIRCFLGLPEMQASEGRVEGLRVDA